MTTVWILGCFLQDSLKIKIRDTKNIHQLQFTFKPTSIIWYIRKIFWGMNDLLKVLSFVMCCYMLFDWLIYWKCLKFGQWGRKFFHNYCHDNCQQSWENEWLLAKHLMVLPVYWLEVWCISVTKPESHQLHDNNNILTAEIHPPLCYYRRLVNY